MKRLWPGAVLGAGLTLAVALAAARGLPGRDVVQLVALSFGVALAVTAVGVLARRRLAGSHRTRAVVVAMVPVAALALGCLSAAQAMFVSGHDLDALLVVIVGAGTAGVLSALVLALDMEAAEQRLGDSHDRERMLERSRRELVAWVSHDLRTPLSGIRAMVEALDDGVVSDDATVHRYYRSMQAEVDRLAHLVNDLFELSRIQADALQLTIERVSLGDVVSDALASATAVAEAKGVRLDGRLHQPVPVVELSTAEMSRVVCNLLDNAIRHTPPGGSVVVEVGDADGRAFVSVADQCGGIAGPDLDRVFDLAYRGDAARTPGDGRAGLGLAIARGFVEAHAGVIAVANETGGCRFTVTLPLPMPA
ncbi:MAG: sensor histidine kinase [Acidimicrobiia bacterium]